MAGLLQFDPNDPRLQAMAGPDLSGFTPVAPPPPPNLNTLTTAQLQGASVRPGGLSGLLSNIKDATYTPDDKGMTFWDKLGAFGAQLQDSQDALNGRGGGAGGGRFANVMNGFAERQQDATAADQRKQLMDVADSLNMTPREKLIFLSNPGKWAEANSDRLKFHDITAGNTGAFGDPTMGGSTLMANRYFQNGNVTGMQTPNGTANVQAGPMSADEVAKQQDAMNGAVTANKPQVVSEGGSLVQSGVAPQLVPGMPGAPAGPSAPQVLYHAPKMFAPQAGTEATPLPDENLIQNLAQQVAGGGQLPSLGVGKAAVALKTAILTRAAAIQQAGGIDGFNALYGKGDNKAAMAALVKQRNVRTAMEQAERQMNANLDAGLQSARQGGAAPGILLLSGGLQTIRRMAGDPNATTEHGYIDTAGEELAKLVSGSTGNTAATDSSRHDAKSRINSGMPIKQLEAAAAVARKEAHNRLLAAQAAEDDLRRQIVEGSYGQNATMGASISPRDAAAAALRAKSSATRGWSIVQ